MRELKHTLDDYFFGETTDTGTALWFYGFYVFVFAVLAIVYGTALVLQ